MTEAEKLKLFITRAAQRLGFSGCRFARAGPLVDRRERLYQWLATGCAGTMAYLERHATARLDPTQVLPGVRTVVSLAFPYPRPRFSGGERPDGLRGRVAAYALGPDYHGVIRQRLRALANELRRERPATRVRTAVDTAPLLEREWGRRSGLGWIGRNTSLLSQREGSWFFCAEMLVDVDLPPDPPVADRCGTCCRCLRACPTGALGGAHFLEPRLCISYLTIEHRGAIPPALRHRLGTWIFGCDLCQEACPWGGGRDPTPQEADLLRPLLPEILRLDEEGFRRRFGNTAVARTRRCGLSRNAAIALGNTHDPRAIPALTAALGDADPLVRGHAAWALGEIDDPASLRALERARAGEQDPGVAREITAALGRR